MAVVVTVAIAVPVASCFVAVVVAVPIATIDASFAVTEVVAFVVVFISSPSPIFHPLHAWSH